MTSKGVVFTMQEAKRLWRIISSCKSKGESFVPSAKIMVGGFGLDRVTSKGDIHAGCHLVKYKEAKRMASELQFI